MKAVKTWLLRWLGGVSIFDHETLRQQLRDEYRAAIAELKAEYEATMANVIQELNDLRNRIPAAAPEAKTTAPVRVFRSFREFRDTAERRPIQIERKSS